MLFYFWGFGVLEAILKYLLQFISEYRELETEDPGDLAEESLGEAGEVSGEGG